MMTRAFFSRAAVDSAVNQIVALVTHMEALRKEWCDLRDAAMATRHYKAGVVFLAWLNGHQSHFSMAGGLQSARDVTHYARVFELADACGALTDPELAVPRMRTFLQVNAGIGA